MLTDEVTIQLKAGDGGRGAVAFNRVRLMQGPAGGDGGKGGSVYFEGVTDLMALAFYAHRKEIRAEDGKAGRGQFLDGRNGEDLVLKVPVGTRITDLENGEIKEIDHPGERVLMLSGGLGGKGNFKFRSSVNTSPKEFQTGLPGAAATYKLELRLIADVGLVGLPNAGKSSLLNELTNARSKVANYSFTTVEPHLGSYYGLILADIPGLIEGASEGKGLGIKFLKHIERTKVLFHLISAESEDPVQDYRTIRSELEAYSPMLSEKKEYVFLTKIDAVLEEESDQKRDVLKAAGVEARLVSVLEPGTLEDIKKLLNEIKSSQEI